MLTPLLGRRNADGRQNVFKMYNFIELNNKTRNGVIINSLAATFMKQRKIIISLVVLTFLTMTACRKNIPSGTSISASGIVFDAVKNKALPNAKLYLFGAHSTFYGIYYDDGPIDSTISDNNGKFSIHYTANGKSVDYGLTLGILEYGGYNYGTQTNYVLDYTQPIFKFNYLTNVTNAIVKGRELNYTQIHIKVISNPFDTIFVKTSASEQKTMITGLSIDTTIIVRHLPNQLNTIAYYTESLRDTVGLAALNSNPNTHWFSITRAIYDSINANMSDTIFVNKTIINSLLMPRQ